MIQSVIIKMSRYLTPSFIIIFTLVPFASHAQNISAPTIEEIYVTSTQRARPVQDIPLSVNSVDSGMLEMSGTTDIRGLMGLAPSFHLSSSLSESSGTTARIRGVGTQGNNPGLESAVGIFVDGVFRNRNTVGLTDLGNLERIEVLRGPQGTLFGRNTSAGMLNIITKKPEFDGTKGYLKLSTGDYSLVDAKGGISFGSQDVAGGIDFTYTERDGFFERDAGNGEEYNTKDRYGVRGQLYFQPSDDFDLRIIADTASRDESCCGAMYTEIGGRTSYAVALTNPFVNLTSDPDNVYGRTTVTTPGRNYDNEVDEQGLSAEFNVNFNGVKFTSISAIRNWEALNATDADFSAADILYRGINDFTQEFDTITQEFRLNGQLDNFDWLVGLYYSNEDLDHHIGTRSGADYSAFVGNTLSLLAAVSQVPPVNPPIPPNIQFLGPLAPLAAQSGDGANDDFATDSTSLAFFTHNTWRATDKLEFTLGLRYTKEDKDLSASINTIGTSCQNSLFAAGFAGDGSPINSIFPIANPLDPAQVQGAIALTSAELALMCIGGHLNSTLDGNYSDSISENNTSGTLAASYFTSDNVMLYGSYSKGYKSGGFNLDRSGIDTDSVLSSTPGLFGISTDPSALEFEDETVDAFELGAKTTLMNGAATLNVTYFNQTFEDFQLNTFNGLTFFVITVDEVTSEGVEFDFNALISDSVALQAGAVYNKAEYASNLQASDGSSTAALSGEPLTHAPEWVFTGALTYNFPIGSWNAFAHLDFRYTDDHNTGSDLDPEKQQDAYTLFNGRIGIASPDDRWSIHLWAQNLTDEEYAQVIFDSPGQNSAGVQSLESYSAFLGDPRTWGLTFGYQF